MLIVISFFFLLGWGLVARRNIKASQTLSNFLKPFSRVIFEVLDLAMIVMYKSITKVFQLSSDSCVYTNTIQLKITEVHSKHKL